MKKLYIFLIVLFHFQHLVAQQIDTAEIKRVTADIQAIQFELNKKVYQDKVDNQFYNIIFPPVIFTMDNRANFSTGVMKVGNIIMFEVVNNIDLNKMINLSTVVSPGGDMSVLRVVFPRNSLEKISMENADTSKSKTSTASYFDLYYPRDDVRKEQQLILDIYTIRMLQKQSKGEPIGDDQTQMGEALQAVEADNSVSVKKVTEDEDPGLKNVVVEKDTKVIQPLNKNKPKKPIVETIKPTAKKNVKENVETPLPEKKASKPIVETIKPIVKKNIKQNGESHQDRLYSTFMSSGNTYLSNGKFSDAQTAYWNAIALKPLEQEPRIKLEFIDKELAKLSIKNNVDDLYDSTIVSGLDQLKKESYNDAEASFQEALRLKPESVIAREQLNNVQKIKADIATLKEIQRIKESERKFNKQVEMGDEAIKDKRYSDAYVAYKEALSIHPNDEWCLARVKIAKYQMELQK